MQKVKDIVEIVKLALEEKKAQDIVVLNVEGKTDITDYFVIASGRSSLQVKAISDFVCESVEKAGIEVKRKDGMSEGRWVVLDIGDVIVHIFHDETRLFYHLERLWQ